jgi:phosphoenolpyruvate carboxylase
MRVAPLFETLNDLDNSTETMEALLGNEWYLDHIKGEQEVMIGYSDSGKDAGRLAAAWGLYEVQEKLIKVAEVGTCVFTSVHV